MIEYKVKVHKSGTEWYLNGKRHREDGPAVEYAGGGKEWWINDKLHREDGPAIESINGTKSWWINGKELTGKEFKLKTSPVKEMTMEELVKELGYNIKIIK